MKNRWKKEIMKFNNKTIMVSEDSNGRPYYYIKEIGTIITFESCDEAMDYIVKLMS